MLVERTRQMFQPDVTQQKAAVSSSVDDVVAVVVVVFVVLEKVQKAIFGSSEVEVI